MRPFDHYVGHGEHLSEHACPACDRIECACTLDQQVEAALRPMGDDDDDRR